jgi:hypothetical protein
MSASIDSILFAVFALERLRRHASVVPGVVASVEDLHVFAWGC